MIRDVEIAWLAGIVDGEGCIYGHRINQGRYATGGNICIEVRIQATSLAMINKIAEICDGIGVIYSIENSRWLAKSTKPAHRICIGRAAEVSRFLTAIFPYLVVKQREAEVALSWYAKWGDQRGANKRRATLEEKIVLFDSLRALKKTA